MGNEMMRRVGAVFAAALFTLAGCSGEDGSPGKEGTSCSVQDNGDGTATVTCTDGTSATVSNGTDGTNGTNGQSCTLTTNSDGTRTVTCPDGGTVVLPAVTLAGKVSVGNAAVTTEGADVVVTFNIKLNGVNSDAFTNKFGAYRTAGATSAETIRTSIATSAFTVTANGAGNYTARFPGLATTVGSTPTTYMVTLNTGPEAPAATVVAHSAAGKPRSTVSDQACMNCHGGAVFAELHHENNPSGVGACVVCHVRADRSETRLGTASTVTNGVITGTPGTAAGTRLMGYVHGIHNSHEMPAGSITANLDPDGAGPLPPAPYTVAKPAGVYARNGSLRLVGGVAEISSPFSIGFPSYMNNCSTCHDTDANLALVMAKPVAYSTCMSCHENWDGFTAEPASHAGYTASTNCALCHGSGAALTSTVGDFHGKRQMYTPRNGLLYDGKDQSIVQGKLLRLEITGVTPVAATTSTVSTIASLVRSGTNPNKIVTVTTTAAHTLTTGDWVTVTGTSTNYPGGQFRVTVIDATSFSYGQSTPTGAADTAEVPGSTREVQPLGALSVTWKAYDTVGTEDTADDTAYDPCNPAVASGPVFMNLAAVTATGQAASNMSLLQAYAQGNDWVNAGVGTSPGQPPSAPTLFMSGPASNTSCASNVATSVVFAAATTATKGTVALQGKPQVTFTSTTAAGAAYSRVIQLRSKSPTREFVVADGSLPALARRPIVSNDKCLACHQGSLYQHGGNRVDSVDLCVTCHNPASNEKNNRVGMGVDAAEAYDGKVGQTYDLRYMLHAIHSAGETNAPLVYYRSNGIYAFGSQAAIDALPNWPGSGSLTVYGSSPPTTRTHNEIVVHYPRPLTDCGACHVDDAGSVELPSTFDAVAVTTYDAGGTSYGLQTDDVLMSPATASCMSCHQSGENAMQSALRAHAYQNSWTPAVFTNGRADILGGGAFESCLVCHGAGQVADFSAAHGN